MRLGQLARKLAIRPSQIMDFLADRQVFPEEGSNAKLNDAITEQIILQFAPDKLKEIMKESETDPESEVISAPIEPTSSVVDAKIDEAPINDMVAEDTTDISDEEKPEVIKAPKVELSGLKVLGKIELKEPKKKETQPQEQTENVENAEINESVKDRKPRLQKRQKREVKEKPWRNPVALQREREAREADEKRKKELEKEKERKTQHYYSKIKQGQPVKAAKIIKEPVEQFPQKALEEKPKTWIGKFLRWLNT
jgi:hypothetical protein